MTKKLPNQLNSKKNISKGTLLLEKLDTLELKNTRPSHPRKKYFGEQIQMDASVHDWFGTGNKDALHVAIDDVSGHIVGAWFEKEKTLKGYYTVFHQILTNYGIPNLFKTDRRTIFEYESLSKKNLEDNNLVMLVNN